MKPSVGRTVHYVAYGTPGGEYPPGTCRAAVVTEAYHPDNQSVGLCILNPTGMFFTRGVLHNSENKPGTWHWPERVEE